MREYGLVGEKLSHSYSRLIHNQLGDYNYELIELSKDEFLQFMQKKDFSGVNVTIPYKKEAVKYCDVISDEAKLLGNVNTVVKGADGLLYGYNTDIHGFISMAKKSGIEITGKKAAVLGSGGDERHSGNCA